MSVHPKTAPSDGRVAAPHVTSSALPSPATTRLQKAILCLPRAATWQETAEKALRAGADLDATMSSHGGRTLLIHACIHGPLPVVRWLLEQGANPNAGTWSGGKPLMVAAEHGHAEAVRLLLERGADPNAVDKNGWNALLAATSADCTEAVRLLLEHGATPDAARPLGDTALMLAAQYGTTQTMRLLLDHGADPNATDHYGRTTLMRAVIQGGSEKTVRLLIARKTSMEARDKTGCTALAWAAWHGRIAIATLLLAHGADPNAQNQDGETVLAMAARRTRPQALIPLFGPLFAAGADPSITDSSGRTLPESFMRHWLNDLVQAMDIELARPALAATRRRLLDRLTTEQRTLWLPRSCTAETTANLTKAWSRQP